MYGIDVDHAVRYNHSTNGTISPATTPMVERALWELIFLGLLIGIVIMLCVLGNFLVIVTVLTHQRLHNSTNFFILCLATTDFLLGVLVLPFSGVLTLHTEWPLGPVFCNIYISMDVMLCTVSILTLFAISIDRYFAVTMPLKYQRKVTSRLVGQICGSIWIFSFVLAFIPIHVGWNSNDGYIQNYSEPKACVFMLNKIYVCLVSFGTYFAPLIIMCAVYMKVLVITKRQVIEINKLSKIGFANDREAKKHVKLASDTKATITLASLVLAFAICWVPYFVLFTAKPFVSKDFNIHLDLFVLWLGYVNSCINPFLYAYYSTTFRNAFVRVLCRGCMNHSLYMRCMHSEITTYTKAGGTCITDNSELSALNGRTSI